MKLFRYGIGVAFAIALATGPSAAAQTSGLSIVVIEGEGAVNIIQQKTAVSPLVEVRDVNGQPVGGATVRFAIQGGRATFNGARAITVTTNAAGRAAVTGLTPTGSGTFQINASASFQGQTATATIAQTNVATAAQAASVIGVSGAGSTGSGATAATGGAAGGGAGGGLSATTIGIVGGAAAGGALVAKNVLFGGAAYKGTFSGPFTSTYVTGAGVISQPIVCLRTDTHSGTLTMKVDIASDGRASGSGQIAYASKFVSASCPGSGDDDAFDLDPEPVSGTSNSLSAAWTKSNTSGPTSFAPGGFTYTSSWSFSGSLTGTDISGTLTQSDRDEQPRTSSFIGSVGTGSTTYVVTLQKQ